MSKEITLTAEQASLIPQYVEVTNLIAKKAVAMESQLAKSAKDEPLVKTAAAEQAKYLLEAKLIQEHEQKQAEAVLNTHSGSLSVLKNALKELGTKTAELIQLKAQLGSAVPSTYGTKMGAAESYNSLEDPYCGRKTTEKKASDRILFERLGIPLSS